MSKRTVVIWRAAAAAAAGIIMLFINGVGAAPKIKTADFGTIENTGSTNIAGYTIAVYASGRVVPQGAGAGAKAVKILPSIAAKLLHDVIAAEPLSHLKVRHGVKSASFGTSTFIIYHGQRSPDLSFPGDAKSQALHDDVQAIVKAAHLGNQPRRSAPMLGTVRHK
jgi:hypothetical protein